jgi:hypothetical protein
MNIGSFLVLTIQNLDRQWNECLVPEIPQFAFAIAERQIANPPTGDDHWHRQAISHFGLFQIFFHNWQEAIQPPTSSTFFAIHLVKIANSYQLLQIERINHFQVSAK